MDEAKLTGVAPILLVRDIVASANYWRDQVGFAYDELHYDPPSFAMLQRDGLTVMLA